MAFFLRFLSVCVHLTESVLVLRTKLTVTVIFPLILLLPALTHAESIMHGVRLCRGEK